MAKKWNVKKRVVNYFGFKVAYNLLIFSELLYLSGNSLTYW